MSKRNRSKIMEVAKFMPPLRHSIPDQEFDVRNSEVLNWLVKQPEILNYVWNNIKSSGAIIYDQRAGRWMGINHDD
ncbi:hypothetical protein [Anaerosinus massiliensis]|uniref:hypothetical protein n=1 Tax=Massilibacillus massiliensis TaxID=1806837 RepID=UPI0018FE1A82|nr:hypothetical protein [Massilibacillus massiliensis]